ncbi:MAG: aminoglycoside phosphotransferase family protein [Bacteroidales bacterium]|jgi:aminoglycoside phosphotransferase (APT) family kinase protein|nr:aminoglycoside phosphotransferase family protein [Bacteroidales bacterium]
MKKSKELAIVKKLTNINDENRIVLNEIGWTSRVYIVDNGEFVFKFLKSKKYQEELEHEISILKLIKKHVFNVNVPLIHWVGEDNAYIGFHGMKGNSMTTKDINKLNEAQKRKIGIQIGSFLKKLHSIDYKGESPNNEDHIIEWFQKSFYQRKRTLKKHFNENELSAIEELVTGLPQKSAILGIEQVFCHGDLGYNNILLTADLEVGVIDFGDAGNLDKSYDFSGLEDDIILEAAISAYGGDKTLREKIATRRQLLPLMEMLFLIDRKDKEGIRICADKMNNILKNTGK